MMPASWRIRLALALMLVVASIFASAALRSAHAAPGDGSSIPHLAAMPEDDFAKLVVLCRSDFKYAKTTMCENAEAAFELRYAEMRRKGVEALMRSPLFWVENPFNAWNVMRGCDAGERWAAKWCSVVRRTYAKGKDT